MRMTRRIWIQLAAFVVISLTGFTIMAIGFMQLPNQLFGIGHYKVTVQLPEAGGLYKLANVTYRGTEVGRVDDVRLTDSGVEAVMSLRSDIKIPRDLKAEVHSQSAVGEQYIELIPAGPAAALKNGDVIPLADTSVPPDINSLLDATNRGLQAIPGDNLRTVIDESYTAVGGLGPELSRFVDGATALSIDARKNLDDITSLTDDVAPVLDTQTDTSDSVQAWAAHVANITKSLQSNDAAIAGLLQRGAPAAAEVSQLFDRLQPTLPIVLANLVSVGNVAVTYRDNIEQLLVLLPQGTAAVQGISLASKDTKQAYKGANLSFNLNLNLPPPCTTGFLPIQQQRASSLEDYPDRPAGDVYCRTPQDATFGVRGLRNTPCVTRPGKRAPTVKMCESDEQYVPLNDGYDWKGDPNATVTGQDIPQLSPGSPPQQVPQPPSPPPAPPPPVAVVKYDPATGTYVGPDGHVYTQANLAQKATEEQTWQTMLLPPPGT